MSRRRTRKPSLFDDASSARPAITHILPVAKDPNLSQIKVDGRQVAILRASDALALGLEVGNAWTNDLASRVIRKLHADKARRDALTLLSRRACSALELGQRLSRRGHKPRIVQQVVQEIRRDGWLDERALAEDVVRSAGRRAPAGRRLIEQKLAQRGIDAGIVRKVSAAAAASQDDRAAAYQLARRRLATMKSAQPQVALRRIAGLLARRGFEQDIVEETVEGVQALLAMMVDDSNA